MLTVFAAMPQDTTYYPVLRQGINKTSQGYNSENFLELANLCERISLVKTEEWLPYYYGAYAYINMSFLEKTAGKKDEYCIKAKILIEKAKALNPQDSEIDVLQALLCYALMEITPMVNGPVYLPRSKKALEAAKAKNPGNPRIYYLEGKSAMYMPAFMGGGKEAAIPLFEKALELFNKFTHASDVHPSWGRSDTANLLEECKNANN